jgi:anti-sigma-K factor RskA
MNTTSDNYGHAADDVLAGEFALGVLDAEARVHAEQRLANDSEFAHAVAQWHRRLAPMAEKIAPVAAPTHVWPRISDAIDALLDEVPATPYVAQHEVAAARTWWNDLPLWRWLGGGAIAVAALSLLLLLNAGPSKPAASGPGYMVATLAGDTGARYVATVDIPNSRIVMVPVAHAEPGKRVPELWVIAPGQAPRSLGVIAADHATTVNVPAEVIKSMGPDDILAITLEPAGGAPQGKPTGPIIGKGNVSAT